MIVWTLVGTMGGASMATPLAWYSSTPCQCEWGIWDCTVWQVKSLLYIYTGSDEFSHWVNRREGNKRKATVYLEATANTLFQALAVHVSRAIKQPLYNRGKDMARKQAWWSLVPVFLSPLTINSVIVIKIPPVRSPGIQQTGFASTTSTTKVIALGMQTVWDAT